MRFLIKFQGKPTVSERKWWKNVMFFCFWFVFCKAETLRFETKFPENPLLPKGQFWQYLTFFPSGTQSFFSYFLLPTSWKKLLFEKEDRNIPPVKFGQITCFFWSFRPFMLARRAIFCDFPPVESTKIRSSGHPLVRKWLNEIWHLRSFLCTTSFYFFWADFQCFVY